MAGALTAAIAAAFSGGAAVVTDDYFEYTTLLLPGSGTNGAQNNTFLDGSTNNFTITRNGNTTQGTFSPFSQTGWGNYFSGSNQIAATPSASELNFSTGDFTVEFWAYVTSNGSEWFYCSSTSNNGLMIGKSNTYTSGGIAYGRKGVSWDYSTAVAPVPNTWEHVAITRSGTSIRVFKNGTQIGTTQTSSVAYDLGLGNAAIGSGGGAGYMVGHISNFRAVKGRAVYTSDFTPPTAPLTRTTGGTNPPQGTECSLLTCQSNRFLDSNGVNTPASSPLTITATGSPTVVAFSPFNPTASWSAATNGGSGYFDGSGDYLSIANNSAFDFGSGDFSIEAWIYVPNVSGAKAIITKDDAARSWIFVLNNADALFAIPASTTSTLTNAVQANTWVHLYFGRSGNTMYKAVNGSVSSDAWTTTIPTTSTAVEIGRQGGYGSPFTGYISGLRVLKGSAAYTSNFTPSAPPTAISNTVLLTNFANAGIYDATSKNDLETVGNAQISNTTAKFGSTSMSFDGTDDRLTNNNANNPLISLGTGDFTIEGWIYANTVAGERGFLQISDTVGGLKTSYTTGIHFALGLSPYRLNFNAGGTDVSSGSTYIAINTWYHIAATRSSGSVRLFINGTLVGGPTTVTTDLTGQYICVGGYYNTSFLWNGYIQDLRITKGYARYTSNFTAPTAAFPTL